MGIEPQLFGMLCLPLFPIIGISRFNPKLLLFAGLWMAIVLPIGRIAYVWDPRAFKKYRRYLRWPALLRALRPLVLGKGRKA